MYKFKLQFMVNITLIFFIHIIINKIIVAKETPEPSSLLQPRHFNPHPYTNLEPNIINDNLIENINYFFTQDDDNDNDKYRFSTEKPSVNSIYSQGPIQFPTNNNENKNNNKNNNDLITKLSNPYVLLSLKSQKLQLQDYENQKELVLKPTLQAFTKHAENILQKKTTKYNDYNNNNNDGDDDDDDDDNNETETATSNKHYAFSYRVHDKLSGDDFSHSQQQTNGGAVTGSYNVQLPDGRIQIVRYKADNDGYKAEVSYLEDNNNKQDSISAAIKSEHEQYKNLHNTNAYEEYNQQPTTPTLLKYSPVPTPIYHFTNTIPLSKVKINTYNIGSALPSPTISQIIQHPSTTSSTFSSSAFASPTISTTPITPYTNYQQQQQQHYYHGKNIQIQTPPHQYSIPYSTISSLYHNSKSTSNYDYYLDYDEIQQNEPLPLHHQRHHRSGTTVSPVHNNNNNNKIISHPKQALYYRIK